MLHDQELIDVNLNLKALGSKDRSIAGGGSDENAAHDTCAYYSSCVRPAACDMRAFGVMRCLRSCITTMSIAAYAVHNYDDVTI
mmetsp:Transcript_24279/g.45435  ORF Transcript_24279/g.45435 Transcript_24279/m.45435 type:complete len:84 (+) Transcript_24279:1142-1393(+)